MRLLFSSFRSSLFALFSLFALLSGCSQKESATEYQVAMDSSWYPLLLEGKENNVTAFSTELLQKIDRNEHLLMTKVTVSWNTLVGGLKEGKYNAILSSMFPYPSTQETFDFSELYLATGPVLVMATSSPFISFSHLSNKEIAVMPDSKGTGILEKYPSILIRNYSSTAQALNDVSQGIIDGALVNNLIAIAYCQDLYEGKLQIVTPPLNQEGLRLVTLRGKAPELIDAFNEGLESLQRSKEYDQLLQKWHLSKNP